jgi:hypothetical protein
VQQEGIGSELYTDAQCTESTLVQLAGYSPGCDTVKTWVRRDTTAGICEPPSAVVEIGGVYSQGGDVYQKYDSGTAAPTCSLRSYPGMTDVYTLGATLGDTIPKTTRVSTANGRLGPALVASIVDAQGLSTRDLVRGWHDNDKNVDCVFATATDGKVRCLPVAAQATLFYSDASCQSATRVAGFDAPSCGADSRYALEASDACPPTLRVYSIGPAQDIPNGSSSKNGHCAQVPLKNVYPVTEVDPTEFAEGTLSTD